MPPAAMPPPKSPAQRTLSSAFRAGSGAGSQQHLQQMIMLRKDIIADVEVGMMNKCIPMKDLQYIHHM